MIQGATFYVVVEGGEESDVIKPTLNFRGSFEVCGPEYRFDDLEGGQ